MKILAAISLCVMMITVYSCNINAEKSDTVKTATCFTEANFDNVYKYIENQIKNGNKNFYKYEGYELFLTDSIEISFKKNGYSLSKITKEKGAISLPIKQKDHDKTLEKTNQIFCKILSETEKNSK